MEINMRIGMLTSGGDCQALNAAMRGVAKSLYNKVDADTGWYKIKFEDGYAYITNKSEYVEIISGELEVAKEISGLQTPNLLVYGGDLSGIL